MSKETMSKDRENILRGYDFALEDANNKQYILDDLLELYSSDKIYDRIRRELYEEAIDAVVDYMRAQRLQMADAYEEEYIAAHESKEIEDARRGYE